MSRKRPRPDNYHERRRARRGRGEWSIHQRKDGTWCGQGSYGYDGEGKRIRPTLYANSKSALMAKIEAYKKEIGDGAPVKKTDITVGEHFKDWLKTKKGTVAQSTYLAYEAKTDAHIIRYLGNRKVRDLDHRILNNFYHEDLPEYELSPRYMFDIGCILRMGLRVAVNDRIIPIDVITKASHPPKLKSLPRHLIPDEVDVFLQAAKGQRMENAFITDIHTGLRPGELLGMTWPKVDFQKRLYTVDQSLHEDAGKLSLGTLKTPNSYRTIPLSDVVIEALRDQQRRQVEEKARNPRWKNEYDLVFPNTEGGLMSRSNFLKRDLRPTLARAAMIRLARREGLDETKLLKLHDGNVLKAGDQIHFAGNIYTIERSDLIERVTTHSLRHTHASILIHMGVDIKIVSAVLGHKDVRFTYDTYVHLMPGDEEKAAAAMDEFASKLSSINGSTMAVVH